MRVKDLVRFIVERDNIRLLKEDDNPRPWTKDSILGQYRFCNVHREDDAVTRWLRLNWYPAFTGDPDVWFAAVVARLLNLPESLGEILYTLLPWQPRKFKQILEERRIFGQKNFNAAYIVSTNGVAMDKVEYIVTYILNPMWKDRKRLRPGLNCTLSDYHILLTSYNGMGSFLAAQVIADLKYVKGCELVDALDRYSFAASGPGSRRGLNRVMGNGVNSPWKENEWHMTLSVLRVNVNDELMSHGIWLDAQDLQNCLCEFDKYERARLGEGLPKQLYREKE